MACIVFYLEDGSSRVVSLDGTGLLTVGRHPESNAHLTDPSVSSHHATVKRRDGKIFVQDLGSSNGTRLNGAEIEEARVSDGDRIAFGDVRSVFYEGAPPPLADSPPAATAAPPPDAILAPEAKPVAGAPPIRKFKPKRFVRASQVSAYPDQTGSGCMSALFLTVLLAVAFFAGLALRHYTETDRSLMSDLIERITRAMPKVKFETEAEKK